MYDQAIAREIQANGLIARRVTLGIATPASPTSRSFSISPRPAMSPRSAILTTQNGSALVCKPPAAVSPENDNSEIREKPTINNSLADMWPLMGYALKDQLDKSTAEADLATVMFKEFLQYGRDNGANIVGGVP